LNINPQLPCGDPYCQKLKTNTSTKHPHTSDVHHQCVKIMSHYYHVVLMIRPPYTPNDEQMNETHENENPNSCIHYPHLLKTFHPTSFSTTLLPMLCSSSFFKIHFVSKKINFFRCRFVFHSSNFRIFWFWY
jgi:hypothetical protein